MFCQYQTNFFKTFKISQAVHKIVILATLLLFRFLESRVDAVPSSVNLQTKSFHTGFWSWLTETVNFGTG